LSALHFIPKPLPSSSFPLFSYLAPGCTVRWSAWRPAPFGHLFLGPTLSIRFEIMRVTSRAAAAVCVPTRSFLLSKCRCSSRFRVTIFRIFCKVLGCSSVGGHTPGPGLISSTAREKKKEMKIRPDLQFTCHVYQDGFQDTRCSGLSPGSRLSIALLVTEYLGLSLQAGCELPSSS
jgi:hypothetical protein